MKFSHFILLVLLAVLNFSCVFEVEDDKDEFFLEGYMRDDITNQPVPGMNIHVRALTQGGGIIGGSEGPAGDGKTDSNGLYKIKIKARKDASRLDLHINSLYEVKDYASLSPHLYLKDLNRSGSNSYDISVSPTTLLKISFRNTTPHSDSDQFSFGSHSIGSGAASPISETNNCGTVQISEAGQWIGKDVCGVKTIQTLSDRNTTVYWTVRKNGILNQYKEKVLVQRGMSNAFTIEY